jgi:hypothetical protein
MPSNINRVQDHFAVLCDACGGKRYIGQALCPKCHGVGRIIIVERPALTFSQLVAKRVSEMLFVAAIIGLLIIAVLRWFHVI